MALRGSPSTGKGKGKGKGRHCKEGKGKGKDCKKGMIENVNNLVVHEYGDKDNIMTYKQCRKACKKEEGKCKAFDYNEDECRGVSVIGTPRLEEEGEENPDGRTFCTMEDAATDAAVLEVGVDGGLLSEKSNHEDDSSSSSSSAEEEEDETEEQDSSSDDDEDDDEDEDNKKGSLKKKLENIGQDMKDTGKSIWKKVKGKGKGKGKGKDCKKGMIENVNNLVVHEYGDKDNIMTYKQCRKACKKEEG